MEEKWKSRELFCFYHHSTGEGLLAFETAHSFPTNDQNVQHCRDGRRGGGGGG